MGKSKSKSNSRSMSKWKKFFTGGGEKTHNTESREELGGSSQGNLGPNHPRSNLSFSGNSRSKSLTKRKNGTREDAQAPKNCEDKINDISKEYKDSKDPNNPKDSKIGSDDKKKEKEGSGGIKNDDPPSKPGSLPAGKKKEDKEEASVFEEVEGPAAPVQTGTHGIKNKMRWKIDVEGADLNGDQKMPEVLGKLAVLKKKSKIKKCKVLKANEKLPTEEEEEPNEDVIINSARVLQLVKLEALITKEIPEADQEVLRGFCRSGDHEDKAELIIEKIVISILNSVVVKNEFIRQVSIPGQLRMFAVDDKKAKTPMMALLLARKDLLYVSWSKPSRDYDNQLDQTWAGMAVKKVPMGGVQSAHF